MPGDEKDKEGGYQQEESNDDRKIDLKSILTSSTIGGGSSSALNLKNEAPEEDPPLNTLNMSKNIKRRLGGGRPPDKVPYGTKKDNAKKGSADDEGDEERTSKSQHKEDDVVTPTTSMTSNKQERKPEQSRRGGAIAPSVGSSASAGAGTSSEQQSSTSSEAGLAPPHAVAASLLVTTRVVDTSKAASSSSFSGESSFSFRRPSKTHETAAAASSSAPAPLSGGEAEPFLPTTESFPFKLYRILEEAEREGNESIISFIENGTAFLVHQPEKFVTELMPRYFSTSRIASFQRQLNMYGFERINQGRNRRAYFNRFFRKGRRDLCRHIIRRGPNENDETAVGGGATTRITTDSAINFFPYSTTRIQPTLPLASSLLPIPSLSSSSSLLSSIPGKRNLLAVPASSRISSLMIPADAGTARTGGQAAPREDRIIDAANNLLIESRSGRISDGFGALPRHLLTGSLPSSMAIAPSDVARFPLSSMMAGVDGDSTSAAVNQESEERLAILRLITASQRQLEIERMRQYLQLFSTNPNGGALPSNGRALLHHPSLLPVSREGSSSAAADGVLLASGGALRGAAGGVGSAAVLPGSNPVDLRPMIDYEGTAGRNHNSSGATSGSFAGPLTAGDPRTQSALEMMGRTQQESAIVLALQSGRRKNSTGTGTSSAALVSRDGRSLAPPNGTENTSTSWSSDRSTLQAESKSDGNLPSIEPRLSSSVLLQCAGASTRGTDRMTGGGSGPWSVPYQEESAVRRLFRQEDLHSLALLRQLATRQEEEQQQLHAALLHNRPLSSQQQQERLLLANQLVGPPITARMVADAAGSVGSILAGLGRDQQQQEMTEAERRRVLNSILLLAREGAAAADGEGDHDHAAEQE